LAARRGEHQMVTGERRSHLVNQECWYHHRTGPMRLRRTPRPWTQLKLAVHQVADSLK
jgi:hypothetical protein